jgi:hypothetical protein
VELDSRVCLLIVIKQVLGDVGVSGCHIVVRIDLFKEGGIIGVVGCALQV